MPEYLSPGVYVEEVDAGPKPIEGVSTSTVGAVGVTARGPDTGKPILITSFANYVRVFGGTVLADAPTKAVWTDDAQKGEFWTFPLAIKGFFDNGGQQIYVRRVVAANAAESTTTLGKGVVATVIADSTTNVLKLSSLIGISKGAALTLVISGVATNVTIASYNTAATTVTVTSAVPLPKVSAGDYLIVQAAGAGAIKLVAKSKGEWGDAINVRVSPMEAASYSLLADSTIANNDALTSKITADVGVAAQAFDIPAADAAKLKKDDRIIVNGKTYTLSADAAGTTVTVNEPAQLWKAGWSVIRVRYAAKGGAGTTLQVWGASSLYLNALVEIEDTVKWTRRYDVVAADVVGNTVTLTNPIPEALWEGQKIKLIEAHFQISYQPDAGPAVSEDITNVRLAEAYPGDPEHIAAKISADSTLINVVTPPAISITSLANYPLAVDAANKPVAWMNLSAGNDDLGGLDVDAFVGFDGGPGKRTGIQALEDIDEISIVIVPSMWSAQIQSAMITHCETLKYRFAILDPRPINPNSIDPIGDIRAFREGFDTEYAALYFPRIESRDPFGAETLGLGPSGHMAGIYARVDVERGVHKAPANEVIRGIDLTNGFHGLEDEITKREQDLLNPKGINALRFFPDRGTRVWGARTLSSDGSWKYINVRRIFIYVERSIDVGTQWVVFEPNDDKTWARVRQSITNFLTTVWRSGALFGTKADEAFFVRCDRTTMTQDDIDNGRLICVIGIAPVKPAEFVIFRVQQKLIDQDQP